MVYLVEMRITRPGAFNVTTAWVGVGVCVGCEGCVCVCVCVGGGGGGGVETTTLLSQ